MKLCLKVAKKFWKNFMLQGEIFNLYSQHLLSQLLLFSLFSCKIMEDKRRGQPSCIVIELKTVALDMWKIKIFKPCHTS